jgi:pilus assembly protein TadC
LEVRPLWPVVAVSVVLAGAVVVALGYLEPASVRRRHEQLVRDLPQALDLLAAALEAGLPLRRATEAVVGVFDGPVGEDLSRVLIAVNLGIGEARAWRELGADPTWRRAAGDVARSVESGSMTVETLRQHAAGARAARRAQIEVTAKAVGVRSVLPLMLCFMPAFILIGIIPTVASAMLAALF